MFVHHLVFFFLCFSACKGHDHHHHQHYHQHLTEPNEYENNTDRELVQRLPRFSCAAKEPTEDEIQARDQMVRDWLKRNDRQGGKSAGESSKRKNKNIIDRSNSQQNRKSEKDKRDSNLRQAGGRPHGRRLQSVVVPVCFHSISTKSTNTLSDAQLQLQLDALNVGYSSDSCCGEEEWWCKPDQCSVETGVRFAMAVVNDQGEWVPGETVPRVSSRGACVTRSENAIWYSAPIDSLAERVMHSSLRVGDAGVMNVYIRDLDSGILGYATFPWNYNVLSASGDGVNMDYVAIAGGPDSEYDEGDVLLHEAGHWLGLFHTFQNGCISEGVVDTPAERSASAGCPVGRNTCTSQEGFDPIHNFMDYTDNTCQYEFTPGQVDVIQASWDMYRSGA